MKLMHLKEYRKAPLGQELSKEIVANLIADEDNSSILRTHISVEGKDLIIHDYSFDANNRMFAVTNRLDHNEVAAYMIVKKFGIGWQVQDVAVYSKFRNLGIGIDLYVKVVRLGLNLISGYSLSNQAEKVWIEKLPKFVNVQVYNKSENLIYKFSNKPTFDNGSDLSQDWFYVASSNQKEITGLDENYTEDGLGNLLYENWILNRGIPIQSYRSSKFGDLNDF